MDDKITIIEGPPPVFEAVNDGWALGLNESAALSVPALTRLRTFNGPALVERCYRAWKAKSPINLHYRNDMGMEQSAPILAARGTVAVEIGLDPGMRVGHDPFQAVGHHLAVHDHPDTIAGSENGVQIVGDHHHGQRQLLLQADQQLVELGRADRAIG